MANTMQWSETVGSIAAALAQAQGEIQDVAKAGDNPMLGNRYPTLEAALASVRPVFSRHGLGFIQSSRVDGQMVTVETMLMHSSGEWVTTEVQGEILPPGKRTSAVQMMGGTMSYLRRYSIMALAGIAPEDSDGNHATDDIVRQRKSGRTPDEELADALQAAGLDLATLQAWGVAVGKQPTRDPLAAARWLRGPGASTVRGWVAAQAAESEDDEEPESEDADSVAPTSVSTQPKWSQREQSAFFAVTAEAMKGESVSYDDLKAWCAAHGRPKPSLMPQAQRARLVDWLTGDAAGAHEVAEWLAKRDEVAA